MTCYLVRHGKDDDTVRGGWSDAPLTREGILQAEVLAERLAAEPQLHIARIYSSDLNRARQTAQILAQALNLPVRNMPQFREVNNGMLAGMKNAQALEEYPGLFWNTLEWDSCYPDGESPHIFYDRIRHAWKEFKEEQRGQEGNVALITHGGVINVILHIERGLTYSNKKKPFPVPHTELLAVEC